MRETGDMIPRPQIRAMTRPEVDVLVEWATAEGWNPGLHDADAFWATDPDGWIAAETEGELIGGGSIVSYDGRFGFMGFFIVRPDYRGRGWGGELWHERKRRLFGRLDAGAAIGMDGVFEMQDWYAKGGFVFERRDIRYRAIAAGPTHATGGDGVHLVDASDVGFEDLVAYDAGGFGVARERFLGNWIGQPEGDDRVALAGGQIVGFGVIRRCREGAKVGPLFADGADIARSLYDDLAATYVGEPVFLDIPEDNVDAMAFARERGMEEVFGCARMAVGTPPPTVTGRTWGVTTFELG